MNPEHKYKAIIFQIFKKTIVSESEKETSYIQGKDNSKGMGKCSTCKTKTWKQTILSQYKMPKIIY